VLYDNIALCCIYAIGGKGINDMTNKRRNRNGSRTITVFVCSVLFVVAALMWVRFWSGHGDNEGVSVGYNGDDKALSSSADDATGSDISGSNADADVSDLSEKLQNLYDKNPDARDFVLNYDEYKDENFEIDLSEYDNCTSVPLLMQWDKRWGYKEYAGGLFGLTGCGPTALSMVAIYLTGDSTYSPEYMRNYATENGYSVDGNGSAWTLFSEGAVNLGFDVTEIPLDKERVIANLEVGNPVVCIMGPGDFTDGGHYIVMTGVSDGQIIINDSNSYTNSNKTWDFDQIKDQIRNLWVIR
jgi:hypothetical protein